jgi:VPDSG-CTERM motif
MIGLNLGGSAPVTINGNTDTVTRSMNAFSPLDAAAAGPATAYGNLNVSTIVVDVTGYEYLAAKYDDGNAETEVWYVGNLSGNVDIPVFDGKYGISTTTLLSPTTPPPSVPDGGSTLLLLGSAISGLGLIRRKLSA